MLGGVRRQGVVGKDGKIEIQASEMSEGTMVEVIVLVERDRATQTADAEDTTAYLLSTEANHQHLMRALRAAENRAGLVSFFAEEWDEEHNLHS